MMEDGAPRRRNGCTIPFCSAVCGIAFLTLSPAHVLTLGVARNALFALANILIPFGRVAQLAEAPVLETGDWGCNSLHGYQLQRPRGPISRGNRLKPG